MQRQQPFWSGELVEPDQEETNRKTKRGWPPLSLPLLLALCGHGLLFWLLSQQSWLRPEQSSATDVAIETYFYQPPTRRLVEPLIVEPVPEPAELPTEPEVSAENPASEPVVITDVDEAVIIPGNVTLEQVDAAVKTDEWGIEAELVVEAALMAADTSKQGSLMDRALRHVQPTEELASAHRAQQIQRQAQPKITVEKRYQEIQDGSQPIRNARGCLIGDATIDGFGFDGLMAAKYVPCGDEMSAGQQLQEILQRRSKHLGRSK